MLLGPGGRVARYLKLLRLQLTSRDIKKISHLAFVGAQAAVERLALLLAGEGG